MKDKLRKLAASPHNFLVSTALNPEVFCTFLALDSAQQTRSKSSALPVRPSRPDDAALMMPLAAEEAGTHTMSYGKGSLKI
ncbi:hypothetical protein R1flu_000584 [Riccia fluitans]|uniref:Uncharacterized protein n=1 Tax=Riccia fluitans TaxID=41844 RepID=A0ABD1Y1T0_9MARC